MEDCKDVILEILNDSKGFVAVQDLYGRFSRKLGLEGSRTRGLIILVERALRGLVRDELVDVSTHARPVPTHVHNSTIGRDVKPNKLECCVPSENEKQKLRTVTECKAIFIRISEKGVKMLKT